MGIAGWERHETKDVEWRSDVDNRNSMTQDARKMANSQRQNGHVAHKQKK